MILKGMTEMKPEIPASGWHTSSYSGANGDCVEVATGLPGGVAVRDSKDRTGPVLSFTAGEWQAFLAGIRNGEGSVR